MVRRAKLCVAAAACSLCVGAASANEIGFNGADGFAWAGQTLTSDGFSFLAVSQGVLAFLSVDAQPDIVGDGSRRLLAGNRTDVTMTRIGGGSFDLLGLSFGGSWLDPNMRGRWADAIEVVGKFGGGAVITQYLDLRSAPASLQSILLNGFVGVDSVCFHPVRFDGALSSDYEFVLDNINVASVPEPETWLMLGVGLAALVLRRRRA